jgi:hypothetical protein
MKNKFPKLGKAGPAIFYFGSIFGLLMLLKCAKEYSCENCKKDSIAVVDSVPPDTIIVPPEDTIISNMTSTYNFYIADNSQVKVIYVEYTSKYHPDTYLIFDQIKVDNSSSATYIGLYNLKDYLPKNEKYKKGDAFVIRYEIRYKNANVEWVDSMILIY